MKNYSIGTSCRIQITKIMYTETGHRLLNYDGLCAHLHGHSYKWEVTVSAPHLDGRGFVMDYKELKSAMKQIIGPLDHSFLFHADDPLFQSLSSEDIGLRASNGDTGRYMKLPFNPTTENILRWICPLLEFALEDEFTLERVKLWETATSFGEWINESIND